MSREVSEDATELLDFFEEYSLQEQARDSDFREKCRSMHKKLHAFMTLVFELEYQNAENINEFNNEVCMTYLKEVCSDLLLAIFSWANGAYKPAHAMLRSSIECFLKGIISINNSDIVREKSVYKIFEIAETDYHFYDKTNDLKLQEIHSKYGVLCQMVHSAENKIFPVDSMGLLPKYDRRQSADFRDIFTTLVESFMSICYINYPQIVYSMHEFNRIQFIGALSDTNTREILELLQG